jgi:MFS-type transporter involved in bile tolerance (Atg22 family)
MFELYLSMAGSKVAVRSYLAHNTEKPQKNQKFNLAMPPTLLGLLLETIGSITGELFYSLISPGKSKWSRISYYASVIFLLAGLVCWIMSELKVSNNSYYEDIGVLFVLLSILLLFLITPILKKRSKKK